MLVKPPVVGRVQKVAKQAADRTTSELSLGQIVGDEPFTERLITRTQDGVNALNVPGVLTEMRTLTNRRKYSEESRSGADVVGVLNVELPSFSISKGFLAQAKLQGNRKDLHQQCHKMLCLSHASYVFIYRRDGIKVLPAQSIISDYDIRPDNLSAMTFGGFMREFVKCFLGDWTFPKVIDPQSLEGLLERTDAGVGFRLSITYGRERP